MSRLAESQARFAWELMGFCVTSKAFYDALLWLYILASCFTSSDVVLHFCIEIFYFYLLESTAVLAIWRQP